MKVSAADQIYALLQQEALLDEEVAQRLPNIPRSTLRRARRELVIRKKIAPVGEGRAPRYKATTP
jgi:hypothetical protein